jgi:hypothetical protein
MKKILISTVALTAIIGSTNIVSAADGINIFNDIKLKGEIRPRYEMANVDKPSTKTANAFTARTHLTITTGLFKIENLSATIGIQSVNNFGYTSYNSTNNGNTQYDVIKDPQFAMLSEASLDYKVAKTALHGGRSQLNLDNQRFIGTVGWRQIERSYDTISATSTDIENLELMVAYLYGYQGVGATPTTDTSSVLLHAKYKVMDELTVTAYDYMLASKNDTIGLALTGNINVGAKLDYRAEYAIQKDPTMEYQVKNVKADATYYNLDLGANISGLLAGINYEVLSGTDGVDGKTTFTPLLGTNHKFNGWADMFYVANSPLGGLKDANIRLGYTAAGLGKLLAIYHDFKANVNMVSATGTTDNLGSEFDILYANAIPGVNGLSGLIKYASYSKGDATGYTNNKQVAWVQLDYKF